jgi:uncharacterized membrane protein
MVDRQYPGPKGEYEAPSFETSPLSRTEYMNALVHFYRGELDRSTQWRLRLDNTTNWAIFSVMGLITFSLGDPSHSHVGILAGMILVFTFLGIEARRFRFFDVWRSRVRMLEENFFIPIIRRNLVSPRENWREFVAQDLDRPKFKITFLDAVGIRLRCNYIWIFLAILVAWFAKLYMHPTPAANPGDLVGRMRVGPLGGPVVLALVGVFYTAAIWLAALGDRRRGIADEIHGIEQEMDHWKT